MDNQPPAINADELNTEMTALTDQLADISRRGFSTKEVLGLWDDWLALVEIRNEVEFARLSAQSNPGTTPHISHESDNQWPLPKPQALKASGHNRAGNTGRRLDIGCPISLRVGV